VLLQNGLLQSRRVLQKRLLEGKPSVLLQNRWQLKRLRVNRQRLIGLLLKSAPVRRH
jgi:hypothetical protein